MVAKANEGQLHEQTSGLRKRLESRAIDTFGERHAMASINVYLTFNGNCEEAFDFYRSVIGGEFSHVSRFKDIPEDAGIPSDPADAEKIMHISLPVSGETMLSGSDTSGVWAADFRQGNNFSISITADSKEHADRLFRGLSDGGMITMPMANVFWGDYFGMLTDKFGINWMVSFNAQHIQPVVP